MSAYLLQIRQCAGLLLKNNLWKQYASTSPELKQNIKVGAVAFMGSVVLVVCSLAWLEDCLHLGLGTGVQLGPEMILRSGMINMHCSAMKTVYHAPCKSPTLFGTLWVLLTSLTLALACM